MRQNGEKETHPPAQIFPMLVDAIGSANTFWIHACRSLDGLIFFAAKIAHYHSTL